MDKAERTAMDERAVIVVEQPYHGGRYIIAYKGGSLTGWSYPSAEAAQAELDDIKAALAYEAAKPVAGEYGGPPNGYHPLPAGVRCRCVKLWTDGKGDHWCCQPVKTEAAEARALAAEAALAKAVEAIELAQDQLNTYRGAAVEEVIDKFEYVLSDIRKARGKE